MIYTVRDLIKYLMDFNMDAEVTLNVTGVPENFDISWSSSDGKMSVLESKQKATDVHLNIIEEEK